MASSFLPVLNDVEKASIGERQPLPDRYLGLSDEELDGRIAAAKTALGARLLILGHHYQRDEVIRFADVTGDSYRLSQHCAAHPEAEFIVFCGVHFMAESADVLSAPHQQVILPDLAAGCSMADMAAIDQLESCWSELGQMGIDDVVPVTYINSSAAIKAFVGEQGGVVCTSSNAAATLRWAWARGKRILFLPDQHLGRNTAFKMGVPLGDMVVWDPDETWGGLEPKVVDAARLILWKGHCSVHTRFTAAADRHASGAASRHPRDRAPRGAVRRRAGGRRQRFDRVHPAVRCARALRGRCGRWAPRFTSSIAWRTRSRPNAPCCRSISSGACARPCSGCRRTTCCGCSTGFWKARVHNQIVVPDEQKYWVRVALERMLSIA